MPFLLAAALMIQRRNHRGRPPKYGRPSRAVTMTLPEDVIARLGAVEFDLGRAVVRLVERAASKTRGAAAAPTALASYGSRSVILVAPVPSLRKLSGVELVPLPNGQALISLTDSMSIAD